MSEETRKPERLVSYSHPLFEHITGYPSSHIEHMVAYQTAEDVERIRIWECQRSAPVRYWRLTR